jgi:hypothetical protein
MIISSATGIVLDIFASRYEGFPLLAIVISGLFPLCNLEMFLSSHGVARFTGERWFHLRLSTIYRFTCGRIITDIQHVGVSWGRSQPEAGHDHSAAHHHTGGSDISCHITLARVAASANPIRNIFCDIFLLCGGCTNTSQCLILINPVSFFRSQYHSF